MVDEKKLPEVALTYLKYGTALLCTWPPSSRATTMETISIEVRWWLLFLLAWWLQLAILYTIYVMRGDFMELTKNVCFGASIAHGTIKMIICRYHRAKYQKLIGEVEDYLAGATPRERQVLNMIVKKAAPVYLTFNITGFVAAASIACGPVVLNQDLPVDTVYPFEIRYYPVFQIIYATQALAAMQCSGVGPLDAQVCMLFWFTIARLELLAHDVRNIASVGDLNACIRVHQSLLRFNEKACEVARPIIMTTVCMATLSIAFGAMHVIGVDFPMNCLRESGRFILSHCLSLIDCKARIINRGTFVQHEPFEVKAQFVGIDIGYGAQLYLSAWAAENLMTAMTDVKWALYDSPWLENTKRTNKSVLFVLQRLNRIPKVSVGGFIPELSLNYYATSVAVRSSVSPTTATTAKPKRDSDANKLSI